MGGDLRASDVRQRILKTVTAAATGVPLSKLKEECGVGWGALYHHVRHLESAGALRIVDAGKRRLALPAGSPEADAAVRARALLLHETTRRLAHALLDAGGPDVPTLAARLGCSERTVYYHLRRMAKAGLVTSSSGSRYLSLRPTPLLARLAQATGTRR